MLSNNLVITIIKHKIVNTEIDCRKKWYKKSLTELVEINLNKTNLILFNSSNKIVDKV